MSVEDRLSALSRGCYEDTRPTASRRSSSAIHARAALSDIERWRRCTESRRLFEEQA